VFTVMGGFMAGAGVLTVHPAHRRARPAKWYWLGRRSRRVCDGRADECDELRPPVGRWVLLLPALLWAVAVVLYARQA
jgi:hypothetical protein